MLIPSEKNWAVAFNQAFEAYVIALHRGGSVSNIKRANSVAEFLKYVQDFEKGGDPALQILKTELSSQETLKRDTAIRLLIEIGDRETLAQVSESILTTGSPQLKPYYLKRLWEIIPQPKETFEVFYKKKRWEYIPMMEALLQYPTSEALDLFEELVATKDWNMLQFVVKSIAQWDNSQYLWRLVNENRLIAKIQSQAALYLGLKGDVDAVEWLEYTTLETDVILAAEATRNLALLALPAAIKPTEKILKGNDANAIAIAIDAAGYLSSGALVPSLLEAANYRMLSDHYHVPVGDEALRSAWLITGFPIGLEEEFLTNAVEEYTESFREKAISRCRIIFQDLDPVYRYHLGKPLTMNHIVDKLMSPHEGQVFSAYCNLKAITGEDYGFDPDDDLIANLSAINIWQRSASDHTYLKPGGWAYQGIPLPDPTRG